MADAIKCQKCGKGTLEIQDGFNLGFTSDLTGVYRMELRTRTCGYCGFSLETVEKSGEVIEHIISAKEAR